MDSDDISPVSPKDAFASLAEIDQTMAQTRKNIAAGSSGPVVILWGIIWVIGYARLQFFPDSISWLWPALDVIGFAGSVYLFRRSPVKSPNHRRMACAWLILMGYALVWALLLCRRDLPSAPAAGGFVFSPSLARRIVTFGATIPMFAYVIMGLWLDRFFIWLGALVTLAVLAGYLFIPHYLYLWIALTGGGAMIVGGVFIRKFWR
jgi:hypothetical protein